MEFYTFHTEKTLTPMDFRDWNCNWKLWSCVKVHAAGSCWRWSVLNLSQNPSCVLGPDGKWGLWSPWSACTSTCGEGSITRLRLCNNPPPQKGGRGCTDSSMETQPCNNTLCPSEYSSTFLLHMKCSTAILVNITFVCKSPEAGQAGLGGLCAQIHVVEVLWVDSGSVWTQPLSTVGDLVLETLVTTKRVTNNHVL